jgi:hypothetical protein
MQQGGDDFMKKYEEYQLAKKAKSETPAKAPVKIEEVSKPKTKKDEGNKKIEELKKRQEEEAKKAQLQRLELEKALKEADELKKAAE